MSRGKVIKAYTSAYPDPLRALAGTPVSVEDKLSEWAGWLWCVRFDGKGGWVPEELVMWQGEQAVLREDYDAAELTVIPGEELVIKEERAGWLRCATREGAVGWVPASHVEITGTHVSEEFIKIPHRIDELMQDQRQAKAALLESEEKYRALVENSLFGIMVNQGWPPDLVYVNKTFEQIVGYSFEELREMSLDERIAIVHPEDRKVFFGNYQRRLGGKPAPRHLVYRALRRDGRTIWIEEYVSLIHFGGQPAIQAALLDVTERKLVEEERERLIDDLRQALAEIKTLRGIIPICSACKKIRDDRGFWQRVEEYVRDHSEAEFSHSLCPECADKLYPGYAERHADDES